MDDKARRGSKLVVVKAELGKEENGRRETGTLSWLKMKCISGVFHGALGGEDPGGVLSAIEMIQKLLPEESY